MVIATLVVLLAIPAIVVAVFDKAEAESTSSDDVIFDNMNNITEEYYEDLVSDFYYNCQYSFGC